MALSSYSTSWYKFFSLMMKSDRRYDQQAQSLINDLSDLVRILQKHILRQGFEGKWFILKRSMWNEM